MYLMHMVATMCALIRGYIREKPIKQLTERIGIDTLRFYIHILD